MKKHDEGYALVLVLVVITVLCLVAMAMMAASLKNLNNQADSVKRMQEKYAAAGMIEQMIANIENSIRLVDGKSALEQADMENLFPTEDDRTLLRENEVIKSLRVKMTAKVNQTEIKCELEITGTFTIENQKYTVTEPKFQYLSYTVTQGGGADE